MTVVNPVLAVRSMVEEQQRLDRRVIRIDLPTTVWLSMVKEPLIRHPSVWDEEEGTLFGHPMRVWEGISKVHIEAV